MSSTITIEEAQANLKKLIQQMAPGDELVITENRTPVAKLVSEAPKARQPRRPGNCKGMITLLVEDDEHLEGFSEYKP
jgi:prevent-host-death family protein